MCSQRALESFIGVVGGLLICTTCGGSPMANKEDELLVTKVKEAISKKVVIEDIEKFVGRQATINTMRKMTEPGLQI